jgi:hypothetical protein
MTISPLSVFIRANNPLPSAASLGDDAPPPDPCVGVPAFACKFMGACLPELPNLEQELTHAMIKIPIPKTIEKILLFIPVNITEKGGNEY